MRIGVIADTHDHLPAIAEFARRFAAAGVDIVLHAGDYCSPFSLTPFLSASLPFAGVFGRNDGDREGLRAAAAKGMATELYESPHSVDVSGQRILLVHDLADVNERSIAGHSVVIHGFTHRKEVQTSGDSLLINPGEGCGWLHGVATAAILDLESREVDFIALQMAETIR
jgi:putative phosphoesterase